VSVRGVLLQLAAMGAFTYPGRLERAQRMHAARLARMLGGRWRNGKWHKSPRTPYQLERRLRMKAARVARRVNRRRR
jgi:hypothetical protein